MKWTDENDKQLFKLVDEGFCWRETAKQMDKTADSCRKRYYRLKRKGFSPHPHPEFPDLKNSKMNLDEWLSELSKIQSLLLKAQPHATTATVRIKTDGKPIAFAPSSCWHLGGLYTWHEGFKEKFDELMAIDRFYWGVHGDEWESFPPGWANTVFLNLIPPHVQRQLVAKIIDKIHDAGKLLYAMWSNHPAFMERATGEDPAATIYMNKVPYFRARGVLKLYVDEQLYILSVAHRFPGSSIHNPNHSQGRQLGQLPQADLVIQGDKHRYAYQEQSHRTAAYDAGLQQNLIAHLVQTGTAKTGPDPYTLRNWSRGILIWPTLCLSAKQHVIHRVYDRPALKWYLAREDW